MRLGLGDTTEALKVNISYLEEFEQLEIKVVDESTPPKFNPPLTGPFDPILI
jgi:hypothetical protein